MKKDYDEMFRELYGRTFPQLKKKYDVYCQVFLAWNTGTIDSKTAFLKFRRLLKQ